MPALSVIIPAFNVEPHIRRTLESVETAVRHLEKHAPGVGAEVIVVDDASTDGTAAVVAAFAKDRPYVRAIANPSNQGASVGRNRGAREAQGSILCFFDADDVMLERHLFVSYDVLDRFPVMHAAQMKIRVDETLHPQWLKSIEDSVVFNKAIRRDVHAFVGGFLESPLFKILPCEDVFYCQMLFTFFQVGYVDEATVHHFRYPGNALDRQIEKFKSPPGAGPDSETPAERETAPKVYALFKARMADLHAKQTQARS